MDCNFLVLKRRLSYATVLQFYFSSFSFDAVVHCFFKTFMFIYLNLK